MSNQTKTGGRENRYRIIKKETTNTIGEVESVWYIQKKVLWWWRFASLVCMYHIYNYRALIIRRKYYLHSEQQALEVLGKLLNPVKFFYNNSIIERVFDDHTLKDVYINHSNYTIWEKSDSNSICYEFEYDLEKLKHNIDSRRTTVKKTIITHCKKQPAQTM